MVRDQVLASQTEKYQMISECRYVEHALLANVESTMLEPYT